MSEKAAAEYRWSCAGDELTPYNNEARAKLEDAYAAAARAAGRRIRPYPSATARCRSRR